MPSDHDGPACRSPPRASAMSSGPSSAPVVRGEAVEVVLADEHHRQLPHRRQVHGLVERALVGRAVAEERHGHLAVAPRYWQVEAPRRRRWGSRRPRCRWLRACRRRSRRCAWSRPCPGSSPWSWRTSRPSPRSRSAPLAMQWPWPAVGAGDRSLRAPRCAHTPAATASSPLYWCMLPGHVAGGEEVVQLLLEAADPHHGAVQAQPEVAGRIVTRSPPPARAGARGRSPARPRQRQYEQREALAAQGLQVGRELDDRNLVVHQELVVGLVRHALQLDARGVRADQVDRASPAPASGWPRG